MKKKLCVILLIVLLVFACEEQDKVVDGRTIYKKNCVICHGAKGDMGAGGAYNLAVSKLSLEERIHVVTNGRKAMAAYKKVLSEEEIAAVAAYTQSLKLEK
ncbi:MAG: cytochrome c [Bacteroidota bacterium]